MVRMILCTQALLYHDCSLRTTQKYNIYEGPTGVARLQLYAPNASNGDLVRNTTELTYCFSGSGKKSQDGCGLDRCQYPCEYRDAMFTRFPQIEHNAIFVTTRYTATKEVRSRPLICASET